MKKFLLMVTASFAMLVTSCAPKFSQASYFIDYSRYADQGFFISESAAFTGEYKPVGSMLVVERPGRDKTYVSNPKPTNRKAYEDDIYNSPAKSEPNHWRLASVQSALDFIVSEAKNQGANGIIGVKITTDNEKGKQPGIAVSGMLIKRN